jgi:Kae1-associated kinase Bud32
MRELIAQGAEAKLYRDGALIIKDRFEKRYRHPELDDQLRKARTKREGIILKKLPGITPRLHEMSGTTLSMDFLEGKMVKDVLDSHPELGLEIGKLIAVLHQKNIMHADLTTSNMMVGSEGAIRFIDFGLSYVSHRMEDRAVDLHLLRQALESKHIAVWEQVFANVLSAYQQEYPEAHAVLERFRIVESRGRNKQSY